MDGRVRQRRGVLRQHEQPVDPVFDDVRNAPCPGAHDCAAATEGLDDDPRSPERDGRSSTVASSIARATPADERDSTHETGRETRTSASGTSLRVPRPTS